MKKTIVSTVLLAFTAILFFASCKKSDSATNAGASGNLTASKTTAKQGEVITFTASNLNKGTATLTSLSWRISPTVASDSVHYAGDSAKISFAVAGTYTVNAYILDSLTKKVLGTTNTVSVTITGTNINTNTAVAFQTGDSLTLQPVLNASDTGGISLRAMSTKKYQYSNYTFSYDSAVSKTSCAFKIGGVILPAGSSGSGAAGVANATFYLGNLAAGTYPISITWLGTAYTGSLTVSGTTNTSYTFTWNNASPVKITPLTISR